MRKMHRNRPQIDPRGSQNLPLRGVRRGSGRVLGGFWIQDASKRPSRGALGRSRVVLGRQVGAKMGPKRGQKSIQKDIENNQPKRRHLGGPKWPSWKLLGAQNGAKLAPKTEPKSVPAWKGDFLKKCCFPKEGASAYPPPSPGSCTHLARFLHGSYLPRSALGTQKASPNGS